MPLSATSSHNPSPFPELSRIAKRHRFNKGEVIVHKGQMVGGVYLVQSGRLRIYTLDANGNEKPLYSLNDGETCIFSINCVWNQIAYPAWVTVDSADAEVLAIPSSAFRQLYEEHPTVREYVLESLSQRIFDLMSALEEASTQDMGQRINSFLVRRCPADGVLAMGHQEIATALGTAREVVSRHLKQLERDGLVELGRMRIVLLAPEQLAALPGF